MRVRLLLLFVALTGYSFTGFAQSYEPGVLVRSTGDTLRGEIENAFWVEPPTSISFRPAAGSPSQVFQPRQLRAVRLTGGRYFRYETLPIDHAAETRIAALPSSNVTDVRIDPVLAEVLVEGAATLFRVVLPGAAHYLVRRSGQPVLDLSERRYMSAGSNGGGRTVADGNNYRGQLGVYFGDCPAAQGLAQKAAFTPQGLTEVVQAYNATCGPARQAGRTYVEQANPRRRLALLGGVIGGVRYNYLKSYYGPTTCIDCKPHPFGGLYAELLLPGRRAAMYGELTTTSVRSQGLQLASFTYNSFVYTSLLHTARTGLRFFFPLPREKQWLLTLGYEMNFVSNESGVPAGTAPAVLVEEGGPYYSPTFMPTIGLGWRSRRLTVSIDGQSYRGRYDDSAFFGDNYAARLGISYRLGHSPDAVQPGAPAQR